MIEVIPTIEQARQKLGRMKAVGFTPKTSMRTRVGLPPRTAWAGILTGVPIELFNMWTPGWYGSVHMVIPSLYAPQPNPVAAIPFEEQIICYAVLDITWRRPDDQPA
jgi:hypothetical protein